jgi:outer membrane receptor protein involved in Fe transport
MMAATVFAAPLSGQTPAPSTSTRPDTTLYILEELVVTGARERSAPPPVATVRVEVVDVHRSQSPTAYDLVRRVAGLEVHEQGQGPGFASNAVVRGFTSDHSSDVLLVVDGVPLNLPIHGHVEGYADWNGLIPATVSSMRVIHGAASPLYGDFALGGVSEVFTAADATGTEASLSGSSFGDVGGWMLTGFRRVDRGAMVAVDARRTEGWRQNSSYTLVNALLRGWRTVGDGRLEGGLGVYTSDWNSPGFLTVPQFNARLLKLAGDPTDGGKLGRVVAQGRYAVPLSSDLFLQATGWGMASTWDLSLNIPGHGDGLALNQTTNSDDRIGAGGQLELAWIAGANEITLGASGRADRAKYRDAMTEAREVVEDGVDVRGAYQSVSLFSRWRRTFFNRVGADLGLRADLFHHQAEDQLATAGTAPQESTRGVVSPKAGARVQLTDYLALRASSSRGFRSAPGVVSDAGRPPILAWAHELATELEFGRFGGSISLFRMDVTNERTMDPVTLVISSAGGSIRQGVDVEARYELARNHSIHLGGTWNDATLSGKYADSHGDHNHSDGSSQTPEPVATGSRDRVPGVSRYTGRIGLDSRLANRYDVRVNWRFTGPYVPIGESDVETQPYSVLDLGASLPFASRWAVDLELQNAANLRYAEMRASGYINPGAPRALRASLRFAPGQP